MKKESKKALWLLIGVACALSLTLVSCAKNIETPKNEEDTTLERADASEKDTEKDTEAETEPAPELTDELPKAFEEDDICDEIIDKLFYGEDYELIPLVSEYVEVIVKRAQSYVYDTRVIAEGSITDGDLSFDFNAEFELFSHNNRWGLSKYELTYTGDGPKGFDIDHAELQLEKRLGYNVDVTGYTENEDGSYTVIYDYVNLDKFAPVCMKYSGSTAKYIPFEHCSDVWYIDTCQNGGSSYAYMDKIMGTFSLTDGNVTLDFTIADDAVDFYNENGYYSMDYTATLSDGTVHESFATVSPSSDAEFKDWDNRDMYRIFWHTFVFDIGTDYYEFSYRAYKNNSELSGWYLEDVKLTEVN